MAKLSPPVSKSAPGRRAPRRRLGGERLVRTIRERGLGQWLRDARLWGAVTLLATIVACVAGVKTPTPMRVRTLGPKSAESGPSAASRSLSVVHSGPTGDASENSVITLVLSQPLRTLDTPDDRVDLPLSISPPIPGKWQWVGSSAVQFIPTATRLPRGTEVHVELRAGARALAGATLDQTHHFSFRTTTPRVSSHSPADGASGVDTKEHLVLVFDQPIKPGEVDRLGRLRVNGAAAPFRTEQKPEGIRVIPTAQFPRDAQVEFQLLAGVLGSEGGLASPHEMRFAFRVFGPLTVSVKCGYSTCGPRDPLRVLFSNPVRVVDVKKHVRTEPPLKLYWADWLEDDQTVSEASATARLPPRSTVRVEVTPGLVDRYGQKLTGQIRHEVVVGDSPPEVVLGIEGEVLEPATMGALKVKLLNTGRAKLRALAVSPGLAAQYADVPWETPRAVLGAPVVWLDGGNDNKTRSHAIDLLEVLRQRPQLGAWERGALLLDLRTGSAPDENVQRQMVQVTDLSLSGKLSREGSLIWVTRLSTGRPVAGARVSIWEGEQERHSFTSDDAGFVRIPKAEFRPLFFTESHPATALVAQHGSDWTVRSVKSFIGPWRLPFAPELGPVDPVTVFLFTERGVYRPGDEVWVKGIARRAADDASSAAGSQGVVKGRFKLKLQSPNGTVALEKDVSSGEFGSFATRLRVPASAELGDWSVSAQLLDASRQVGPGAVTFSVAEYRPSEFKVGARTGMAHAVAGDSSTFEAEGDYLFGAPMKGAKIHYQVSLEPTSFQPPGSEGWVTSDADFLDDSAVSEQWGSLATGDGELDATGIYRLTSQLPSRVDGGPRRVRFECDVQDVSRQTVSASASLTLHPAEFTLGIEQLSDWFVMAPGTLAPRVKAFSPDGRVVAGRSVTLELHRRRWTGVKESWEGGDRIRHQRIDELVGSCALRTAATPQSCVLDVKAGGYHVVRASSRDSKGRVTYASMGFYGLGPGRVTWQDDPQNARVEVVPNKKTYRIGEKATLLVKSPFRSAEAMVTVERGGVLEHRRLTLTGPTPTIEVPITERLRPNAYVAVHLVKHRDPKAASMTLDRDLYRIGYAPLLVDPEERRLAVEVVPERKELSPGDTVVANVRVKNRQGEGERAELTFFAVDEGVLMLTGYSLPDPVPVFTRPRPLQVATLESRVDLGRLIDPVLGSNKGEEGGGGGVERSIFKESAYFNPSVVTDSQGRAQVRFQLPDNLTTFRLMAVAVTADDRYGSGQAEVRSSRPLMARPALPRFLRAGDRFDASLIVTTKRARSQNVDVSLTVSGLDLESPAQQRVHVQPDGVAEIRFSVKAPRAGEASLRFSVRGEHERDAVALKREVQSPALLETVAAYGETSASEAQRLGELQGVRDDQGGLEVTLASTRLVGLDAAMEQLVDYPYQCTEQLSSRLLPLLPLHDLAQAFGFEAPQDRMRVAENTVREMLKRRHGDGGFKNWPESAQSRPWISAYALWTLWLAKQHGMAIEPAVFQRGIKYLREDLLNRVDNVQSRAEDKRADLRDSPDMLAFAAFVLGELGAPDLGAIERLSALRGELRLEGIAWLFHAASRARAPKPIAQPLFELLESRLVLNGNRVVIAEEPANPWLLSSPTRTQALALSALLAGESKHALAGKLATELLARREGGAWRTTQESAFSLLALDAYRRAQEPDAPRFDARVWAGEQVLFTQRFEGRSTKSTLHELTMKRLQDARGLDVVFERAAIGALPAKGTLFYEARLQYASKVLPALPLDRGFSVEKRVRGAKPEELQTLLASLGPSTNSLSAGSLVVVDLLVTTGVERNQVVVDDPLPAGLEAIDSNLETSSSIVSGAGSRAPTATGFRTTWYRSELRDDRALFFAEYMPPGMYHFRYFARATTLGEFVVPPTRIFEMYQPENYGRTGATKLRVVSG